MILLKKSVSGTLTFILLFMLLTVSANDSGTDSAEYPANESSVFTRELKLLDSLKIMETEHIEDFDAQTGVTRGEFASILCRLYNITYSDIDGISKYVDVDKDYIYASYISYVSGKGLMAGFGEYFKPEEKITFGQTVKAIVDVLGYSPIAAEKGGYPRGYFNVAVELGLLKGMSVDADKAITKNEAAKIIYNALDIDIYVQTNFGEQISYEKKQGSTLLTEYLNIYKNKGIVTGTYETLLTGTGGLKENQILISGMLYEKSNPISEDFLGYEVTYYYEEKKDLDKKILLYLEPTSRNESILLNYDEILEFKNRIYTYSKDINDYKEEAEISKTGEVIYNGKRADRGFADYIPNNGFVFLLDNNSDNIYDITFITEYTYVCVDYINLSTFTVFDIFDSSKDLVLDPYDSEIKYSLVDKNGNNVAINNLVKNDILSVAVSKDGKLIKAVLSREVITGTIIEIDSSDYDNAIKVNVNGNYYTINNECNILSNGKLKAGNSGDFYLDTQGLIAMFTDKTIEEMKIGYVLKVDFNKGLEKTLNFKILTQTNDIMILKGEKKIIAGDKRLDGSEILNLLKDSETKEVLPQVVLYKLNNEGEINYLEIAIPFNNNNLNLNFSTLHQSYSPKSKLVYSDTAKSFGGKVTMDDNAVVFCIAENIDDEKDFTVKTPKFFVGYEAYTITAYKTSSDKVHSDILVVYPDVEKEVINSSIMLVDKVSQAISREGNTVDKISGLYNGKYVSYLFASRKQERLKAWNVKSGDIIRIGVDVNNEIVSLRRDFDSENKKLFKSNEPTNIAAPNPTDVFNGLIRYVYGGVYSKDRNIIRISTTDFSTALRNSLEVVNLERFPYIYMYDSIAEKSKVSVANAGDIIDYEDCGASYSNVLVHMSDWGQPRTIVIYK